MAINMAWGGLSIRTDCDDKPDMLLAAFATSTFVDTLREIDRLARPKHFYFSGATLCELQRTDASGKDHSMLVIGDEPIDEIVEWLIYGDISSHVVNCRAREIFHTHKENRSGNKKLTINGIEDYKLTLEDIWQDSNKWQKVKENQHGQ